MEDGVLGPEGSGERLEASGRGLQGRCSLGVGEPGASARGTGSSPLTWAQSSKASPALGPLYPQKGPQLPSSSLGGPGTSDMLLQ